MTTVTIIGTGLMADALGAGWTAAGHSVRIGTRTPQKVTSAKLAFEPAFIGDIGEALVGADAVVLAVPFPAVAGIVGEHKPALAGMVVIDISNPFDHLAGNERAGVEFTADALGTSERLVAAFKDNFAATINEVGAADGERPDVKIASDDPAAKEFVAALARDLGHRVLDCGPLHNARLIDSMVSLMLILDREYTGFTMKTGWRFTGIPAQ